MHNWNKPLFPIFLQSPKNKWLTQHSSSLQLPPLLQPFTRAWEKKQEYFTCNPNFKKCVTIKSMLIRVFLTFTYGDQNLNKNRHAYDRYQIYKLWFMNCQSDVFSSRLFKNYSFTLLLSSFSLFPDLLKYINRELMVFL